jgi:hypothetical protein
MDGLPAGRDSIISLVYGGYFISLSLASPIELVPHRTPFAVRVHNSHRSGRPVRARVTRVRRKKVSAAPAYVGRRESYSKQATGTNVPWMLQELHASTRDHVSPPCLSHIQRLPHVH